MNWILILSVIWFLLELSSSNAVHPLFVAKYEESSLNTNSHHNNDTLVFAHVIARHGDRNIVKQYPRDPYSDEKYWPGGIGQLTKKGKRQLFDLGKFLRRRYKTILGDEYSPDKVYVLSSDHDRTLMSAEALLAGLFYPSVEETFVENIPWQPIPVHTINEEQDYILGVSKECPKYDYLMEKHLQNSEEMQQIFTKYKNLLDYWSKKSGTNITTLLDCYYLRDTFTIEKNHGMRLPKWVENAITPNGPVEYMARLDYITDSSTREIARLKYGFLLKEMLQHFFQKANSTLQPNRSLWIYSAHDYTISNILNIYGLYNYILDSVPYASCLHIEMFKTDTSVYYVQIFFRKFNEEYPNAMNIPECGRKCPLEKFYKLVEDIIPGDFDTECEVYVK